MATAKPKKTTKKSTTKKTSTNKKSSSKQATTKKATAKKAATKRTTARPRKPAAPPPEITPEAPVEVVPEPEPVG